MKVDIKFEGEGRFQKMGAISKWVWLKLEWGLIVREVRRSCRGDLAMAKWDSVPTSGRVCISEAVGSTPELRPCGVCIPLGFAVFTSF